MDFLNTFLKNKLLPFNLPEQVDRRGSQLFFVTFRFAKKTAVVGGCLCTKANNGSAVIGMVFWHSGLHFSFFLNFFVKIWWISCCGPVSAALVCKWFVLVKGNVVRWRTAKPGARQIGCQYHCKSLRPGYLLLKCDLCKCFSLAFYIFSLMTDRMLNCMVGWASARSSVWARCFSALIHSSVSLAGCSSCTQLANKGGMLILLTLCRGIEKLWIQEA